MLISYYFTIDMRHFQIILNKFEMYSHDLLHHILSIDIILDR